MAYISGLHNLYVIAITVDPLIDLSPIITWFVGFGQKESKVLIHTVVIQTVYHIIEQVHTVIKKLV